MFWMDKFGLKKRNSYDYNVYEIGCSSFDEGGRDMAVKARKDKKGYALRTGECQRTDGRYSYSYTDRYGRRHSIYAKTLVELRAKEKELQRAYDDGLDPIKAAKQSFYCQRRIYECWQTL